MKIFLYLLSRQEVCRSGSGSISVKCKAKAAKLHFLISIFFLKYGKLWHLWRWRDRYNNENWHCRDSWIKVKKYIIFQSRARSRSGFLSTAKWKDGSGPGSASFWCRSTTLSDTTDTVLLTLFNETVIQLKDTAWHRTEGIYSFQWERGNRTQRTVGDLVRILRAAISSTATSPSSPPTASTFPPTHNIFWGSFIFCHEWNGCGGWNPRTVEKKTPQYYCSLYKFVPEFNVPVYYLCSALKGTVQRDGSGRK